MQQDKEVIGMKGQFKSKGGLATGKGKFLGTGMSRRVVVMCISVFGFLLVVSGLWEVVSGL